MTMPQEDIATELLNFIWNPLERFEDKDTEYAYRLSRTRTFLEMKFGYVGELQKEVEALRQWKNNTMPVVVSRSERHDLARRNHPFAHLEEED
jgi:hypothetical protein